jgi:hypothetical protein
MVMSGSDGDGQTITVRVPISMHRRGGRKLVLAPDGSNITAQPVRRHMDSALIKAIARAFRWREMLETGGYSTIRDIAQAERINDSYVSRMLRLTLLAPDIIEAILDGRHSAKVTLHTVSRRFALEWPAQRTSLS